MTGNLSDAKDAGIAEPVVARCSSHCYGGREAWISDCGDFVAIYWGNDVLDCDVIHRDGRIWRGGRYRASGWDDDDPRFVHPEFPKMVTAWSDYGHRRRDGQWVTAFKLSVADYDQNLRWREDYSSASNRIDAVFRRRVPPLRPRAWVRKAIDDYKP